MLVIYTPDGAAERRWEFNPDDAWSWEAELIEQAGRGGYWSSFEADYLTLLRASNFRAKRALLWVMLKREQPDLRFADLAVKVREVQLGLDPTEVAELRRRVAAGEYTGGDLAQVEAMLADYPETEPVEDEPVGKDVPGDSVTAGP